jgi:hypothetical protein
MNLSTLIHRLTYGKGAHDSPNSPENRDSEWQAGFRVGTESKGNEHVAIRTEWLTRGRPARGEKGFKTWRRGFWAGAIQTELAHNLT